MFSEMLRKQREAEANVRFLSNQIHFARMEIGKLDRLIDYYSKKINESSSYAMDDNIHIQVRRYAQAIESNAKAMNDYNIMIGKYAMELDAAKNELEGIAEWFRYQNGCQPISRLEDDDYIFTKVNKFGFINGTKL